MLESVRKMFLKEDNRLKIRERDANKNWSQPWVNTNNDRRQGVIIKNTRIGSYLQNSNVIKIVMLFVIWSISSLIKNY